MSKVRVVLFLFFVALVASSCSEFNRIQKKGSFEERYDAAIKHYEKKDYYRAGILFEIILPLVSGRKEAEKTHLYNAYCTYYTKQLPSASYFFKKFSETYPRSEYAEEALYMHGVTLFDMSPRYNLDQENTYLAINAFQSFITRYPNTKYLQECNSRVDILQEKLEQKAYELAKLQAKIGNYQAAVISCESFRTNFPASKYNEELAFLKIEAQYLWGKRSVDKVVDNGKTYYPKKTRLQDVEEFYINFVDKYSKSKYIKSAEHYYQSALSKLKELES